jgi:predicted nicotinamide N-methyase
MVFLTFQIMHPDYGMYTWPCSAVLAQYVFFNRAEFAGKSVLELGSGTGLCGLVAAKCGAASVTFTDSHSASAALDNCKRSAEDNALPAGSFSVKPLTWGLLSPGLLSSFSGIDFILGSDCFFDPEVFHKLVATVAYLLKLNPGAVFVSSYQVRSADWHVVDLLEQWGLKSTSVALGDFDGDKESLGGSELPGNRQFQLFLITKA